VFKFHFQNNLKWKFFRFFGKKKIQEKIKIS
jgi:hypothetical protein